jgi:hypothetical protein
MHRKDDLHGQRPILISPHGAKFDPQG